MSEIRIEERVEVASPLSWRAIFAGVVVAIMVQILLSMLSGAIGLTLVNPTTSGNPPGATAAIVASIWWTLSGVLAAWAGGTAAGRLSGSSGTIIAAWHGLIAWGVTILLVLWLLASAAGEIVGGAFAVLGGATSSATEAVSAAAPAVAQAADPFGDIETALGDALGAKDPATARTAVTGYVRAALAADEAGAQAATDRAADALSRATGIGPDDAKKKLADWKTQYDQVVAAAKQKAAAAVDAARKAAAAAGILAFVALFFGAFAGWYGGLHSVPSLAGRTWPLS
jgi:hypothetical protein